MQSHPRRRHILEHFGTGFLVVILAAALTHALRNTTFMRRLEMVILDSWTSFQLPQESSDIAIVAITDEEYRAQFHNTSPLSPAKVADLLCAIAHSGPKVIGVDLDTAEWSAADRDRVREQCVTVHENSQTYRIPLVWALGGIEDPAGLIQLNPVINSAPGDCFAPPAIIPDEDGVIRGSYREIVGGDRRWPGFGSLIAAAREGSVRDCRTNGAIGGSGRPNRFLINFRGDVKTFPHLNASTVLGAAFTDAWEGDNPLKNKIVLLGGTFRAGRDRYPTPRGQMDGVNVMAYAIQSELPGGGIKQVPEALFLTTDLLIGFAVVMLTFFLKNAWTLLLIFLAIPFLAFAASLLLYSSLGYFMSFMPVLTAVFIHEVIMHVREDLRIRRELQRLRSSAERS